MGSPDVDLVVNCFERNYRRVTAPDYFRRLREMHVRPFARVVLLINNVVDQPDALSRANALATQGLVDDVRFVAQELDRALETVGIERSSFSRLLHWSDCCFVAVTLPGSEWLCYWDADATLESPVDWITPSLSLMSRDPRVALAGPNWPTPGVESSHDELTDDFGLDYGCTDVAMLLRRSEFARPIYRYRCPASLRYPTAHIEPIFEQRVDAYLRRLKRYRATYRHARWTHPTEGRSDYAARTVPDRLRSFRNRVILSPCYRLPLRHPAMRPRPPHTGPT